MKCPTIKTHPQMRVGSGVYQFTVTEDHVKGSQVGDPEHCAGACALDAMDDVAHAWVLRTITVIEFADGTIEKFKNPKRLQAAVEQYDKTAGVFPPGVYELRPIEPSSAPGTEHFFKDDTGKRIPERYPRSGKTRRKSHALR